MLPELDSRRWLRRERRWLRRARRGDRKAFAELYDAFAGPLFSRVLMPRLGDRSAAEDALAETFRTALERLDDYEHRGVSVWYWLARIAGNKAMDTHRAFARKGRALVGFEQLLRPVVPDVARPDEELERGLESERVREAVGVVLEGLNPRYRRAIELRFFEERSRPDCAERMEVRLGTFDVLLLRALRSFRKHWTLRQGDET